MSQGLGRSYVDVSDLSKSQTGLFFVLERHLKVQIQQPSDESRKSAENKNYDC